MLFHVLLHDESTGISQAGRRAMRPYIDTGPAPPRKELAGTAPQPGFRSTDVLGGKMNQIAVFENRQ